MELRRRKVFLERKRRALRQVIPVIDFEPDITLLGLGYAARDALRGIPHVTEWDKAFINSLIDNVFQKADLLSDSLQNIKTMVFNSSQITFIKSK